MKQMFLLSSIVLTSGSHSAMASPRSESSPPEYVCSILFLAPSCGEGMCCTHISTKPAGRRSVHNFTTDPGFLSMHVCCVLEAVQECGATVPECTYNICIWLA